MPSSSSYAQLAEDDHNHHNNNDTDGTAPRSYYQGGELVGKYALGKVLGAGDFDSRTRLCTDTETGLQYAVKIYDKSVLASYAWMWGQVRDSVHIMRTLPKHENLVEMVECFETKSSLYILMQMHAPLRCSRIYTSEGSPIPLHRTRQLFAQTVRGILHLHDHSVAHLGLAPDHVMVNDKGQVKIGNLVSCRTINADLITDLRGTTRTVAPEVLAGEPYDPRMADAWALGVLLYFMVSSGRYPHDGANTSKHILANQIRPLPEEVNPEARDLIHRLLQLNPRKRMPVSEILNHSFFDDSSDVDWLGSGGSEEEGEEGQHSSGGGYSSEEATPTFFGRVARSLERSEDGNREGSNATAAANHNERSSAFNSTAALSNKLRRGSTAGSANSGDSAGSPTGSTSNKGARGSSNSRAPSSAANHRSGGGASSSSKALVRAFWSEREGLSIVLPDDLPREEEAAYLIQHTYRLYRLKREDHWDMKISKRGCLAQLLQIKRISPKTGGGSARRRGRGGAAGAGGNDEEEAALAKRKKSFSYGVAEKVLRKFGSNGSDLSNQQSYGGDDFASVGMAAISSIFNTNNDGHHARGGGGRKQSNASDDSASVELNQTLNVAKTFHELMAANNISSVSAANISAAGGVRMSGANGRGGGGHKSSANSSLAIASNQLASSPLGSVPTANTDEQAFLLGLQQGMLLAQQQLLMAMQGATSANHLHHHNNSSIGVGGGHALHYSRSQSPTSGLSLPVSRATSATQRRAGAVGRRTSQISVPRNEDHSDSDTDAADDGVGNANAFSAAKKKSSTEGTYFRGMSRGGARRFSNASNGSNGAAIVGAGGGAARRGSASSAHGPLGVGFGAVPPLSPSAPLTPSNTSFANQYAGSTPQKVPSSQHHHSPRPPPPPSLSPRFIEASLSAALRTVGGGGTTPTPNHHTHHHNSSSTTVYTTPFSGGGAGSNNTLNATSGETSPQQGALQLQLQQQLMMLNSNTNAAANGSFGSPFGGGGGLLLHNHSLSGAGGCGACGRSTTRHSRVFTPGRQPFPDTSFSFRSRGRDGKAEYGRVGAGSPSAPPPPLSPRSGAESASRPPPLLNASAAPPRNNSTTTYLIHPPRLLGASGSGEEGDAMYSNSGGGEWNPPNSSASFGFASADNRLNVMNGGGGGHSASLFAASALPPPSMFGDTVVENSANSNNGGGVGGTSGYVSAAAAARATAAAMMASSGTLASPSSVARGLLQGGSPAPPPTGSPSTARSSQRGGGAFENGDGTPITTGGGGKRSSISAAHSARSGALLINGPSSFAAARRSSTSSVSAINTSDATHVHLPALAR